MNLKKWIYEKKADFLCRYRKKVAVSAKEELFSVLSGIGMGIAGVGWRENVPFRCL